MLATCRYRPEIINHCLYPIATMDIIAYTVGHPFLRAINFVDFMDFWDFHKILFYQKLAEILS